MRKFIPLLILGIIGVIVLVKLWPSLGFIPRASRVIFHPGATLKETNGKTNVLLLGIGGGTHDGPDLTDTIIFASIDWKKNTVTLISIPRDLWVPSLTSDVKKINEVYAQGEDNNQHKGLLLTKAVVQSVTGQDIHYGIRLDFHGFVAAIDQIGGIDVQVVRTLDDYEYPITGMEDDPCGHSPEEIQTFTATASAEVDNQAFFSCRYKHLHVAAGLQHMDGETALEFVRSRHAIGPEGSDFARSARQQLVIEAIRSKLISSALFSPGKVLGLYDIIKNSIDTDITDTDLGLFLDHLPQLKSAAVQSAVIDYGDYTTGRAGLLMLAPLDPMYDNLSVLIPRVGNGDFSEIQKFISCEITKGNCTVSITPSPAK